MTRCLWTGAEFPPSSVGGVTKVFVNSAARAEAHKAARQYAEHLIATGALTWAGLHSWYLRRDSLSQPYTARAGPGSEQPELPMGPG